jgi:hypothetical protein
MDGYGCKTHDSLYLLDGNIVLLAINNAGVCMVFRVHKSVLSKNSPVFETMLTLPALSSEVYDGIPLVQLQDGAEEVESLLRVLYHES